jgi:hypothetical protein
MVETIIVVTLLSIITFTIISYVILGLVLGVCSNNRVHPSNDDMNYIIVKNNN